MDHEKIVFEDATHFHRILGFSVEPFILLAKQTFFVFAKEPRNLGRKSFSLGLEGEIKIFLIILTNTLAFFYVKFDSLYHPYQL